MFLILSILSALFAIPSYAQNLGCESLMAGVVNCPSLDKVIPESYPLVKVVYLSGSILDTMDLMIKFPSLKVSILVLCSG